VEPETVRELGSMVLGCPRCGAQTKVRFDSTDREWLVVPTEAEGTDPTAERPAQGTILELRVAELESAVADLQRRLRGGEPSSNWVEAITGSITDVEAFEKALGSTGEPSAMPTARRMRPRLSREIPAGHRPP
jgi:hypothetical protein